MSIVSGGYDFDLFFLLPGLTKIYRWKKKPYIHTKKLKVEKLMLYILIFTYKTFWETSHI